MDVLSGVLIGAIGSLLAARIYDRLRRAELVIEDDPADPMIGRPSEGSQAFFHVSTYARAQWSVTGFLFGARPPQGVRGFVTVTDAAGQEVINKPGRWTSWPEPVSMIPILTGVGALIPVRYVDPKEIARQQTLDFRSLGSRERLDIAIKVEGQADIHFWNNENYARGGIFPDHTLGPGDYRVTVTVEYEGTRKNQRFELSNRGMSWKDVRIRRL